MTDTLDKTEYPGFVFRYTPVIRHSGGPFEYADMEVDSEGMYFDESLLNYHKDCVDGLREVIAKRDKSLADAHDVCQGLKGALEIEQARIKELEDALGGY